MTFLTEERRVGDRRSSSPPSRKPVVLFCSAFLLLAAWSGFQQYQLHQVTKTVESDRVQIEIQGINEHLQLVDQELASVAEGQRQVLVRSDFETAHSSLVRQFEALKQLVSELQSRDDGPELLSLKAKLQSIEDGIKTLEKRVAALSVPKVVSPARSAPVRPNSVSKSEAAKPVPLEPPFQVIGIEIRGGERFLSVAPAGVRRLDQITLLRPGDTQQSWVLETLGATTAEFKVNGTRQIVFVR